MPKVTDPELLGDAEVWDNCVAGFSECAYCDRQDYERLLDIEAREAFIEKHNLGPKPLRVPLLDLATLKAL